MKADLPHSIPQCFGCRHLRGQAPPSAAGLYLCDAYPEPPGIPTPILLSEHDHREPFAGDGGIRFQPATTGRASP